MSMQSSSAPLNLLSGDPTAATQPARRRSAWRLGALFVGVAALVFGSIGTVNYRYNPLTYDGDQQQAVAATLAGGGNVAIADPNIDWRTLRSKHLSQMKETPDVILFGGSRWQEASAAVAPNKRFYNAFVTNDFFEDIVALTGQLYTTGHLPKTLILSVRFFSFDYLDRHDQLWWTLTSPEYKQMSERLGIPAHSWTDSVPVSQYSHLLSADSALKSLQRGSVEEAGWRPTTAVSDPQMNIIGSDGALRFSEAHLKTLTPEGVEKDALETAAQHRTARIHIKRELVGQLGTLIGFLKKQGVQVVLVQTPFHPAYFKAIQGTPYYDDIRQVEADTRSVAAASGALVGGGFDSLALGCTAADYRDFNHASDHCLTQVLRSIPGLN
ncbi:hypothetical protein [Ideonella sp.]|uniref:hypothetical protein n=1 Tax=Ideonella sp. TaxID=1929293 RepID=UPI0035AD9551